MYLPRPLFSIIMSVAMFGPALADGIKLNKGRYADGPVIELKLNATQLKDLTAKYKAGVTIKLTTEQQKKLQSAAKTTLPITEVFAYNKADIEEQCTCCAANYAIIYAPGLLEVPSCWIRADREAKEELD